MLQIWQRPTLEHLRQAGCPKHTHTHTHTHTPEAFYNRQMTDCWSWWDELDVPGHLELVPNSYRASSHTRHTQATCLYRKTSEKMSSRTWHVGEFNECLIKTLKLRYSLNKSCIWKIVIMLTVVGLLLLRYTRRWSRHWFWVLIRRCEMHSGISNGPKSAQVTTDASSIEWPVEEHIRNTSGYLTWCELWIGTVLGLRLMTFYENASTQVQKRTRIEKR